MGRDSTTETHEAEDERTSDVDAGHRRVDLQRLGQRRRARITDLVPCHGARDMQRITKTLESEDGDDDARTRMHTSPPSETGTVKRHQRAEKRPPDQRHMRD